MPAAKGNTNKKKWKTPEERKEAFAAICEHLAAGLSKESLTICDWDTVEAYMKNHPIDFPSEKLNEAMREQRKVWEVIGFEGAKGEIDGFNATAWIFNMKNRFRKDWHDRTEVDHTSSDKSMSPKGLDVSKLSSDALAEIIAASDEDNA